MNPDERQRIKESLVYLTENTQNIPNFGIQLVAAEMLSTTDVQKMNAIVTDPEKLFYVYTEVMKKSKYAELIKILDSTGNKGCADLLRSLPSYKNRMSTPSAQSQSSGVTNFVVTQEGVFEIVEILGGYPSLKTVWKDLIAPRLLSPAKLAALDTDAQFSVVVQRTLNAWIEDKPKDATLQRLVTIIENKNAAAAGALLQNSERIRDA